MTFSRTLAVQNAKLLTREELDLAVHVLCSAFNARDFPGVATLSDVRQMVDVLEHEFGRREKATAEHKISP